MWSLQPDAVLCTAASHGNELAFSELYRRHYPALGAFVFHLLGARHRREDSEDVVQDAFARAFDAIGEKRFSGDFRRWLFTIARNRSIDLLRGERVRVVSLETAGVEAGPQAAAEATTPAALAETRDEVAWLVAAIDQLPERQRSALLLRELAGLSHVEIAQTLDTTRGSARQLITRARDGVRDAAERDGREHETQKNRTLRRELLDATPMFPLAAGGMLASAGTTAGGSFAVGKLVATVLAAMVLAGTAGQVGREVAEAEGSPRAPEHALAAPSSGPVGADHAPAGTQKRSDAQPRSKQKSSIDAPPGREPHAAPGDSRSEEALPDAGGDEATRDGSSETDGASRAVPESLKPVKEIVELPSKAVEHVAGGLSGTSPPDQVVGDVVDDVAGTLGDVTTGLLGPSQR